MRKFKVTDSSKDNLKDVYDTNMITSLTQIGLTIFAFFNHLIFVLQTNLL